MTFAKGPLRIDNYQQPTTNAAMYNDSHRNNHTKTKTSPSNNPTPSTKSTFLNMFKDLEDLISTNECTHHVNNALKTDIISNASPSNYVRATITIPSMSVIFRKMRQNKISLIFTTENYFLQSNGSSYAPLRMDIDVMARPR